jgi:dTMP kinase
MARGKFITFEGGEAVGKSTQTKRLAASIEAMGLQCVLTREPGGVPAAEEIRNIILQGSKDKWDPLSEALLLNAARRRHVLELIEPALARGDWVICDRFYDSTMVYQGYVKGLAHDVIAELHRIALGGIQPDLTIMLDVPGEVTLGRVAKRKAEKDRIEAEHAKIYDQLRAAFLDIARLNPARCVVIDALPGKDEVAASILAAAKRHFGWH